MSEHLAELKKKGTSGQSTQDNEYIVIYVGNDQFSVVAIINGIPSLANNNYECDEFKLASRTITLKKSGYYLRNTTWNSGSIGNTISLTNDRSIIQFACFSDMHNPTT